MKASDFPRWFALVMLVTIFGVWYMGVVGVQNPSPSDIQSRCSGHHGVVQLVPRPWPDPNLRVVCRDGTVFDAK